jgi:hypothetical protein
MCLLVSLSRFPIEEDRPTHRQVMKSSDANFTRKSHIHLHLHFDNILLSERVYMQNFVFVILA